jgi:hypothetical protein
VLALLDLEGTRITYCSYEDLATNPFIEECTKREILDAIAAFKQANEPAIAKLLGGPSSRLRKLMKLPVLLL